MKSYSALLLIIVLFAACDKISYNFTEEEMALIYYEEGDVFCLYDKLTMDTVSFEVVSKELYHHETSHYTPTLYDDNHCEMEICSELHDIDIHFHYSKSIEGFNANVKVSTPDYASSQWYFLECSEDTIPFEDKELDGVLYNNLVSVASENDTLYISPDYGIVNFLDYFLLVE